MRCRYNPYCPCGRCRARSYMGPAVLITIGVLFLLDQMGRAHWMDFGFTWPALLIVIGLVKLLEHGASTNGHIPREYGPPAWQSRDQRYGMPSDQGPIPPATPGYPAQPQGPVATRPASTPAGFVTPGSPGAQADDKGVHNG
jgi:hypothetical protein